MFKLPLNKENQLKEWTTILDNARSNNFPDNIIINLRQQIQQKIERNITTHWTQKQHQVDDIHLCIPTNQENYLFRHTKVKIAFKCNNKISQLIKKTLIITHHTTTEVEYTN